MSVETAIVTTTINIPELLKKYGENARRHGHSDLKFIVIGDRKSPAETRAFCDSIAKDWFSCEYLDIEDQRVYLQRFPELGEHLIFDSPSRRNIGILKAFEDRARVMITIDDDNLILNQDFVRCHGVVGTTPELPVYESTSGWFNVCSLLVEDHNTPFYHRGFPMGMRWRESEAFLNQATSARRVVANAGFWLDDPDIDAVSRMNRVLAVRGLRHPHMPTIALEPGTWSPFNSQNTALMRDAIPAYFLSPYTGRYDDIWGSYVINRIAQHLGDAISFGEPVVRQKRNIHDPWNDVDRERNGMILTDAFTTALRGIPLSGTTYHACFGEIAAQLAEAWPEGSKWNDSLKLWRSRFIEGLGVWHRVFSAILSA
jgi:hypothetical protein